MTNKNKKLISALLLILIIAPVVLFSRPKHAFAAAGVEDTVEPGPFWKFLLGLSGASATTSAVNSTSSLVLKIEAKAQEVLRQVIMTVERRLLQQITQETVNWINSGFSGSPLFVQSPGSFFTDIAKLEVKNLVDTFGYDLNRFPFGPAWDLNVINSYQRQLTDNTQYTLSKVINDPTLLNNYRNNFNTGGWNGFLINTQYPQNNYLGFSMLADQQLAQQLQGTVQNKAQQVQTTLQQGQGFLSPKTCVTNKNYNTLNNEFKPPTFDTAAWTKANPDTCYQPNSSPTAEQEFIYQACETGWQMQLATAESNWSDPTGSNSANVCPNQANGASGLIATTPGSVVGNMINTAMSSPTHQSELGAALGNSVGLIVDALLQHFIGQGLSAMASATSSAAQTIDNWNYQGYTLGGGEGGINTTFGSTGTTPAAGTLTASSQNVSVSPGTPASVTISGGTAPYSIQAQPNTGVASASLSSINSSTNITITGIGPGQTSVEVQDSSFPVQTVTIQVTVNSQGSTLTASPQNVSVNSSATVSATISGGTTPYIIQTPADMTVANAVIAGNLLTITGVASGQTPVVVKDSSFPVQFATVLITTTGNGGTITGGGGGNTTFGSLTASPQSASTIPGIVTNVNISGGTAPYSIQAQPDPAVAIGYVSDNLLMVAGINPGQSSIEVSDSSFPVQTVIIQITVNSVGGSTLSASPQSVSVSSGATTNVTISGGTAPYKIQTGSEPDMTVANAAISDTTLTVAGNAAGQTSTVIQDSSFPVQTITIQITVTGGNQIGGGGGGNTTFGSLTASPPSVSINPSGITNVTISGGTTPYTFQTRPDNTIASAQISGSTTLVITGAAVGQTSIVVQDNSTPAQTVTIQVTVTASSSSLTASPQSISVNSGASTGATISGGLAPYSIKTSPTAAIATASAYGNHLTVTGVSAGQTSVVVQDGSTPAQTVTVQITVSQVGSALTASQQSVSINPGTVTNVTISGGTAPYIVQTPPSAAATAYVSGNNLTITGVSAGQTSVVVKDYSSPAQTVAVQITVSAVGPVGSPLTANPQNVSVSPGGAASVSISGGTGQYSVQTQPDAAAATANISGNLLTITSTQALDDVPIVGQTSVTVQDNSSPAKTVTVQITIGGNASNSDLLASPQSISINIHDLASATVSGGTAPYSIQTGPDTSVALASFSDNLLTITGVSDGGRRGYGLGTSVVIKDSSSPAKTATVQIEVRNLAVLGGGTVSVNPGEAATLLLYGGSPPYVIRNNPDPSTGQTVSLNQNTGNWLLQNRAANVQLYGYLAGTDLYNSVTITGVTPGQTSVTICDQNGTTACHQFTIRIFVQSLLSTSDSIGASYGGVTPTNILYGMAPYTVATPPDPAIAAVHIYGNVVTPTGVSTGQTSVTIQDSSSPAKTVTIPISILMRQ
jgi:hypothetical protein